MKSDECDRKRIFDIGFIDPVRINAELLEKFSKETEKNLLRFIEKQHYKKKILLPYNFL
jgi:hypothetical protein